MKKRKNIIRLLCALLCSMLLISSLAGLLASAEEGRVEDYDFSREGSSHNKVLSAADVLEDMLGEELLEEERAYLVSYGDLSVSYDDGITTANISAILEGSTLRVNAFEYTYESKGGATVVWIPKSAELGGITKELIKDNDAYVTFFEGVSEESGIERVNVLYTFRIEISEEDAEYLINEAKNELPLIEEEILEKTREYENALMEYEASERRYLEYLEDKERYDDDLLRYTEYLREYRLYSEKLSEYNEYLADLEAYKLQLEARARYEEELQSYKDNYPLYVVYLQEKKAYDQAYAEYTAYSQAVSRFRDRLAIMDYTAKTMTPLKRSALAAINGNTVTSVLAERDSLESNLVGAPPKVIDLAGNATDNLRILLNDYFSYTTDQGKYTYYQQNYEAIRDNFVDLFIALDHLYKNASVRAVLYETERDEKYRILVAQLYLIAHALSDEPIKSVPKEMVAGSKDSDSYTQFTYSQKYTMDVYKYTIKDILGSEPLLADNNSAYPVNEPFPTEVPEPTPPSAVEKPVEPEYVAQPTEVTEVDDPGEPPEEVADPHEPPKEVADPGEPPEEYLPPKEYTDLISIKDALPDRSRDFSGGYTLVAEKTVSKKFIDPDEVNVKFYSENGQVLLYETTVDFGTSADYRGAIPVKDEDERAIYTFDGWKSSSGERVSLSDVRSDLNLYPIFDEQIKEYTIRFDVDGRITEYRLKYGTMPSYDGRNPEREDSELYTYVFSGWDKEISAVKGDAVYTAVFDSEYIIPNTRGGASLSYGDGILTVDYGVCFDRILYLKNALERASSVGALRIITPYLTLDLSFSEVRTMAQSGVVSLKLNVSETEGNIRYYSISVLDEAGDEIADSYYVKTTDGSMTYEYNDRLKLFTADGEGKRKYTKFAVDGRKISFTAETGVTYALGYEYMITLAADPALGLKVSSEINSVGESVFLSMTLPDNMRMIRLYTVDPSGKETELSVMRFSMPASDVTVVAEAEYVRYKITFVSEGTVISSSQVGKGELPIVPEAPKKLADENYTYVFAGWSEIVSPATEDKTYYAVFQAVPVESPAPVEQGMTIYQKATLIAAVAIGAFVIIVAAVVAIKINS